MILNREKIIRIIYYDIIPIIIGFFLFGSLGRVTDITDFIQKMIIFAMYIIPILLVHMLLGGYIFSRFFPQDTYAQGLMTKMMHCKIRKEHGDDYCVKCPDGTVCITSVDSVDGENKVDKIKGDVTK